MRKDKLVKAAVNRLFSDGASAKARLLVARALANGLPFSRFAAIAPRKIGTAVLRNRVKRRLRAAWALERAALPPGFDYAAIARREYCMYCAGASAKARAFSAASSASFAARASGERKRPVKKERRLVGIGINE